MQVHELQFRWPPMDIAERPCLGTEEEVENLLADSALDPLQGWPSRPLKGQFIPFREEHVMSQAVSASLNRIVDRVESVAASLENALALLAQVQERLSESEERLATQPIACQVTLHDLDSELYRLRQPLCICIEEYEEETVARFPEAEVYASAATEGEAIDLLKREIVQLYEELQQADPKELGRRPKQWRTLLNRLIEADGQADHPK